MRTIETGEHISELLRTRIEQLGFALAGDMRWGFQISHGDSAVASLDASASDERMSLTLWPDEHPGEVLFSCNPRLSDRTLINESVDNLEGLLRAWLVRESHLHTEEFATDYALKKWLGLASAVRLGREKPRAPESNEIAYRLGEGPSAAFQGSTPACKDIVRTARELRRDFDRDRALELVKLASRTPAGRDSGLFYVTKSARYVTRGRLHDFDMAWESGSLNRALVGLVRPRDDLSLVMDERCLRAPPELSPVAPSF